AIVSLFKVLLNHLRSLVDDVSKIVGVGTNEASIMVAQIREHVLHLFPVTTSPTTAHCGPVPPVAGPSRPVPARLGPTRPVPARRWPVPAPLPPVVGSSPPVVGPFAAHRGRCPATALSRPLPCSRPLSRPCPTAAPVTALPLPPVAASALQPPSRCPALLPPLSWPYPAAATFAAMSSPPVAASALLPPLSRPCPAAAPHPRCPAALRRLLPCPTARNRAAPPCRAAPPSRASPPSRATLRCSVELRCPFACTASAATTATAATASTAATPAMASPTVLTFDAEGRAVDFDVWVDDLQLFLQCDSRDGVSLFDHTSGVSTAPAATADSTVCSQWTTHDAVARLALRSHLPPAERAHFGQYKTAKSLYDAVVVRYSSPATAALIRLMLPYLFPDLAAFATVAELITHLYTSHARYRAALPTEGVPLSPFSPMLLLLLLLTSLALRRSGLRLLPVGGAATARARGARVVEGMAGAAAKAVEEAERVAVEVGVVPGVGASVAAWEVVEAAAEVVEAAAAVLEAAAAVVEVAAAVVLVEVQPRSVEALVVASTSSTRVPVRPRRPSTFVSGTLGVGCLG
ncbi:unnamed protein product, partial [Closterium sp. NIES-53]